MVLEDLQRAIETDFPRDQDPDAAQLEDMAHDTFAASRTRVYVPNEEDMALLDRFAAGSKPGALVLSGESGIGAPRLATTLINKIKHGF